MTYYRFDLDIKPLRKVHLPLLRPFRPLRLPLMTNHMPITALARWITTTLVTLSPIRTLNVLCLAHLQRPLIFSIHHPARSAACQPVQLIANSGAALRWRLTLIEALQHQVHCKAPEEEASSRAAGDEERGNEEEERDADDEEGVDERRGEGE
tara:strand:+ start:4581 stop:5039 length:459 start_codon:yes stop_codon:yes gene_type:complete